MPANVSRRLGAPARAPAELVFAVAERPARADDVHRSVDAVHDGEAVSQAPRVLDLDHEVDQAVAVEVAEVVGGIQRGGEREPWSQAGGDEGAVRPTGQPATGRELRGGGCGAEQERRAEECLPTHTADTRTRPGPFGGEHLSASLSGRRRPA